MLLMSLSFLLMPVAGDKESENWSVFLSGAMFWVSLISGYVLIIFTDRYRKKQLGQQQAPDSIKTWGAFRIASNLPAIIADSAFALSLIGLLVFIFVNSESYMTYIFLCITVFALHMHCMLNGANFKYISD